jgi:predicted dehydrogenase
VGQQVGVGIIGLGAISGQYLITIEALASLRLVAVADLDHGRALAAAKGIAGVHALSVDELLAHPDVEVVVNLTPPAMHAQVAMAAIAAGKSVYNEKPLATTVAAGREILRSAADAGVRVGGAPDTVLGEGVQTARHLIDSGLIGPPTAAVATFVCPGHEAWHPNPDFYYDVGGGPLFDMGPYYVTSLVTLLGPVRSVIGAGNAARTTRTVGSGPRAGETIIVNVLTHVSALLTHESGAVSTLTVSFDGAASSAAPIEVHGPLGSMIVPDPNFFDGAVRHCSAREPDWREAPAAAGYTLGGRGLGVAELMTSPDAAQARTGGEVVLHVLDIMESVLESARLGRAVEISSPARRPAAVPLSQEPAAAGND